MKIYMNVLTISSSALILASVSSCCRNILHLFSLCTCSSSVFLSHEDFEGPKLGTKFKYCIIPTSWVWRSSNLLVSSLENSANSSILRFRKESRSCKRSANWFPSLMSSFSMVITFSSLKMSLLFSCSAKSMSQVPSIWLIWKLDTYWGNCVINWYSVLTLVAVLGDLLLVPILVSCTIGGGGGGGNTRAAGLIDAIAALGAGVLRRRWGGEVRQDWRKVCCLQFVRL